MAGVDGDMLPVRTLLAALWRGLAGLVYFRASQRGA